MTRFLFGTLALLLLSPLNARAQSRSVQLRPVQPQPVTSGILLGVNVCPYSSCERFNTVWIVRENDRVRVAATVKGLVVPRKDGFWWMGVEPGSSYTRDTVDCEDSTGVDMESKVDTMDTADVPFVPSMIWAAPVSGHDVRRAQSGGYGEIMIHWVNSEWIAVSETTMESDLEHSNTNHLILPLDRVVRSDTAIGAFAFRAAGRRFARAVARCAKGFNEWDELTEWTVGRRMTYWEVSGAVKSRGGFEVEDGGCELPRDLTTSIIGHDRVAVPWSAIKSVLPGATMAFESPRHDLLVVLQDSVWYAFFPTGSAAGPIIARFRIAGAPVMAQWAVGAHATRWTKELSVLAAAKSPVP